MALYYYKLKKVSLLAYLFVFAVSLPSSAQSFTPEHEDIYKKIVSLQYDPATLDINKLAAQEAYLLHTHYAIQFLFTEDPAYLSFLKENSSLLTESIERIQPSPWRDFYLAEIKLQSAYIDIKTGNELSAAWQIRQAYKIILKNTERYPAFELNNKTLGLLHVMIGAIPEQYQWIVGLMGMQGDVETGLSELDRIAKGNTIYNLEATILQQVIRSYLLDETKKAAERALEISKKHPDNILVTYITAALFLKDNNAKQAATLISQTNKERLPLLHYQAGEAYLQLGKYGKSKNAFKKFIESHPGLNFKKDAYYKLFLAAWLNDADTEALQYFNKGKEIGQTLTEADKYANRMLQSDKLPNKTIMKIRLFTDGGAYDLANKMINKTSTSDFSSPEEVLEFSYRKARLFHKTGQLRKAIDLYELVIATQDGNQYFAPNSCLQLGYIFSEQGEKNKAVTYFEKAMSYRNHEYKSSIDNKAKTALKLLD